MDDRSAADDVTVQLRGDPMTSVPTTEPWPPGATIGVAGERGTGDEDLITADFDLIVVKSPHTEHHMFDSWSEKNFNVDAPGATSANLKSLGHAICARPIYSSTPRGRGSSSST